MYQDNLSHRIYTRAGVEEAMCEAARLSVEVHVVPLPYDEFDVGVMPEEAAHVWAVADIAEQLGPTRTEIQDAAALLG